MLYMGKCLVNSTKLTQVFQISDDLWDSTLTVHLMISQKAKKPIAQESKKSEPSRPIKKKRGEPKTQDEVFMSPSFQKYEKYLLKEYRETLMDIKSPSQDHGGALGNLMLP